MIQTIQAWKVLATSSENVTTFDKYFYKDGIARYIQGFYNNKHYTDTYLEANEIRNVNAPGNNLIGLGYSKKLIVENGKVTTISVMSSSYGPQKFNIEWKDNKIIRVAEKTTNDTINFIYENGNLIRTVKDSKSSKGETIRKTVTIITYDSKLNYKNLLPNYSELDFPRSISKNNPLKIAITSTCYNEIGETTEEVESVLYYDYTYNQSGYPTDIRCKLVTNSQEYNYSTHVKYKNID